MTQTQIAERIGLKAINALSDGSRLGDTVAAAVGLSDE